MRQRLLFRLGESRHAGSTRMHDRMGLFGPVELVCPARFQGPFLRDVLVAVVRSGNQLRPRPPFLRPIPAQSVGPRSGQRGWLPRCRRARRSERTAGGECLRQQPEFDGLPTRCRPYHWKTWAIQFSPSRPSRTTP